MSIKLAKSKSKKGEIEYYLVGLESFEDFDEIVNALLNNFEAKMLEKLDGIYSRIAKFEMNDDKFKLVYHEDVGNYFVSIDQTEDKNERLCKMSEGVISILQKE